MIDNIKNNIGTNIFTVIVIVLALFTTSLTNPKHEICEAKGMFYDTTSAKHSSPDRCTTKGPNPKK